MPAFSPLPLPTTVTTVTEPAPGFAANPWPHQN